LARRLSVLLITEAEGKVEDALGIAGRALQGGVNGIMVRRPRATAREVFEMTRRLRPATRRLGCLLVVNDRVDVALAAEADGVHLGARSIPVAAARRILGPEKLIGCSVHNLDEAGQAEEAGANYLLLGPLFPTGSHPERSPLGLRAYREAVLRAEIPVLGLGGINRVNVHKVAEAGGPGVAAISAFYEADDAAETARVFRSQFAT
jgi:thiamine-phosphate pyrophosphorylase